MGITVFRYKMNRFYILHNVPVVHFSMNKWIPHKRINSINDLLMGYSFMRCPLFSFFLYIQRLLTHINSRRDRIKNVISTN